MRANDVQSLAEAAADAAASAALQLAEIRKNDRLAALAARVAAAKAAEMARKAELYYLYAQENAKDNADTYAVQWAAEAAAKAKEYAHIAAEKSKWRTNPSSPPRESVTYLQQQMDDIENAWEMGDFEHLADLGVIEPELLEDLL